MIKRLVKRAALLIAFAIVFVIAPLVYPKPLFAYQVNHDSLVVYSDEPIPEKQGLKFLSEVQQKLTASPLDRGEATLSIYVANARWRRLWLWIIPGRLAGGFVVAPFTANHAFFSGADFDVDMLIGPTGYRPRPPRTLAYYGAHELTHVLTYRRAGLARFHLMPAWVREGFADYAAMPRQDARSLFAKIGARDADLPMMKAHGVYAPFRLLVTHFLDNEGWSVDELLKTKLSLDQAREVVFAKLNR